MDAIVSAEVIEMAGEKHILSLTQDITARKRAEEVLREGEEFKNCILNSVHSCIAVLNRNGVIVMVNEPWVRFSVENSRVEGFPALHTGIGVNYLEICRDSADKSCEGAMSAADGIAAVLEGKLPTFTLEYPCHSPGEKRWFLMEATPLGTKDGLAVISHWDITERKQSEDVIINAKKEWEGTFDAISDWVCILDNVHTILRSNKSAAKFCNCRVDEIINKRCFEILHGTKEPILDCPVERAAKSGLREEMEFRLEDGRWLLITVDPVRNSHNAAQWFVHIVKDITRRKRAEESLRESEERFRTIFEQAAVGVAQVDSRTGRFMRINMKLCDIVGYSPEELLSLSFQDITHPDNIQTDLDRVARLLAGEIGTYSIEKRYIHKNGSTVWAALTVSPMRAEGLKPDFHISIVQDITERKLAEAERARLEAENRQLQKAESLGRMAGSIAHLFNNKLAAVMGNLELALDDLPEESDAGKCIVESMKAAHQAAEVSQMRLAYLGQTTSRNEPVDLVETIRESLRFSSVSTLRQVHLKTGYPSMRPIILGNNVHIKQIFANLVSNAVEALGQKEGSITVAIGVTEKAEIEGLRFFPIDWAPKAERYVCLSVSDTGCGMDLTTIEKVFDPFFSTKFTGRGLGLSVLLGLVRAHDGAATVGSSPGQGATFSIFFPLHALEAVSALKVAPPAPTPVKEGGLILLVDDDPAVRKTAEGMLKRMGYEVLAVSGGTEAVKLFEQNPDRVRFAIADLTMPGMDGWATLTALRNIRPQITVILASGYDEAHAMGGDYTEQPNAFLHKPYSIDDLQSAIDKALQKTVGK